MPRDSCIRFEWQAQFLKARRALSLRGVGNRTRWHEAIDQQFCDCSSVDRNGDGTADELTASP